jgi:hypothetical protein
VQIPEAGERLFERQSLGSVTGIDVVVVLPPRREIIPENSQSISQMILRILCCLCDDFSGRRSPLPDRHVDYLEEGTGDCTGESKAQEEISGPGKNEKNSNFYNGKSTCMM